MEKYKPEEENKERVASKEEIRYKGKLFEVVSEPVEIEGKTFEFEKVRRSPGVRLIMRDGQGNILLTREFRRELSKFDYRLPGGKVFDSLDEFNEFKQSKGDIIEKAKQAALKEAREETGFVPDALEYHSTSKLGATVEWDLHYFVASVDKSQQGAQELEAGENIEVVWFSEEEVKNLILESERFSEERSVAALTRLLYRPEKSVRSTQEQEGSSLIDLLKSKDLGSIRLRTRNLEKLKQIQDVIFVGSSLVGKTTLVDALRNAMKTDRTLAQLFQIPKRVITRPQRANDNLVENQFVTADEFGEMVRRGDIGLHWVRKMEGNREERYGFLDVDKSRIPIFSGNNAIINNKESVMPPNLLEHSLIIAVYSPDDLRDERMQQRSPDLIKDKPEEVSYRLSDRAINMYPEAHLVVKNFGHYQGSTKEDIVRLFSLISELKS
ncbi:MAG: NUDIX domain-containing protein [Candidatus Liptonbacteria bacterium]|nr:NUDIX domain-containing protein [Candidatus Liptonbacteria bacterium]